MTLASAPRMTDPPFNIPEQKALEETRIHAIDSYLHGESRPIANTPPADLARDSRTQLQALRTHLRLFHPRDGFQTRLRLARLHPRLLRRLLHVVTSLSTSQPKLLSLLALR